MNPWCGDICIGHHFVSLRDFNKDAKLTSPCTSVRQYCLSCSLASRPRSTAASRALETYRHVIFLINISNRPVIMIKRDITHDYSATICTLTVQSQASIKRISYGSASLNIQHSVCWGWKWGLCPTPTHPWGETSSGIHMLISFEFRCLVVLKCVIKRTVLKIETDLALTGT